MNGVYVENWLIRKDLVLLLMKVFKKHKITFDFGLWCPNVWTGLKGEKMCQDALFHITMEGEALQAWQDGGKFYEDLNAAASDNGYWWEQGYHWSIHLYKK
ncbi:MAG: hypothetical protein WC869_00115 [Phycisphaerae bacterium]|jgi:hypothetical protein